MNLQEIEKRSLAPSKWANLFMAFAGITAAIMSNASALMLDGLFSGVNFLAAFFAAKVAVSVQRKPDIMRPFGYEINEPMYVMFRSLVLTGIITLAVFGSVGKIIQFVSGEKIPPIQMGWIMGYVLLMLTVCFSLASWHHFNWVKTGRESDLLRTERSAALIDGLLSSAAGVAFFGISLLKNTSLAFLVPISDSIVVIGLSIIMIPTPIRMFFSAAREVVGISAETSIVDKLKQATKSALTEKPYTFLDLAVVKTGRSMFAVAYIRPDSSTTVHDLDGLRNRVQSSCETVFKTVKTESIFTGIHPFDEG
jgi:predicted Co/Zn/Cd cation transporter (cation efflux family)